MKHNLPLSALRAFVSAARHESFALAAQELALTSSAVSQQILKLETYLGITLFHRLPQGLTLTPAGTDLLPKAKSIFEQLDEVIEDFVITDQSNRLTISVAPVFAYKWLVPRLGKFQKKYPNINLRITSTFDLVDFKQDNIDAAIRFGSQIPPELTGILLFNEWLTPLCAPELIEDLHGALSPNDLSKYILIHDESFVLDKNLSNWAMWLKLAGAHSVNPEDGTHLSHTDHAFQAAVNGVGFMLGWRNLASDEIAQGRLVQPFGLALPMNNAFRLVYPLSHVRRTNVQLFQRWLLDEMNISNLSLERL